MKQTEAQQIALASRQLRQNLVFGIYVYPDKRVAQLGTTYEDLCRHVHLVGMTGVGKSTLLVNLVHATIINQMGCLLVDPHRDLVSDTLERLPAQREKDVCLVTAFPQPRPTYPIPDPAADKPGYAAWKLPT